MNWQEMRKRRSRKNQVNFRCSDIDTENMEVVIKHLNHGKSYNPYTRTDAIVEGVKAYIAKHKLKAVKE